MVLQEVPTGARMYGIREMEVIRVNATLEGKQKGSMKTKQHFVGGLTHYSKIESTG